MGSNPRDDFYILLADFSKGAVVVSLVELESGLPYLRGERRPQAPIRFRRETGSRAVDLVKGSDPSYHLLSPAALAVIGANELTGTATYPVEIDPSHITGSVVGYEGLSVVGRCGPIQRDRARPGTRLTALGRTVPATLGVYFDPASWDGSDFFMASDSYAFVLVTAKAADSLERAKLTNIRFLPAGEFAWL